MQDNDDLHTSVLQPFGYSMGAKFDFNNHNWVVLREFLALGFCYMSFVIKQKIEDCDNDD